MHTAKVAGRSASAMSRRTGGASLLPGGPPCGVTRRPRRETAGDRQAAASRRNTQVCRSGATGHRPQVRVADGGTAMRPTSMPRPVRAMGTPGPRPALRRGRPRLRAGTRRSGCPPLDHPGSWHRSPHFPGPRGWLPCSRTRPAKPQRSWARPACSPVVLDARTRTRPSFSLLPIVRRGPASPSIR
jgi:hypothetical protein